MTKTALAKINFYLEMSTFAYKKHFLGADADFNAVTIYNNYKSAQAIFQAFSTVADIKKDMFESLVQSHRSDFDSLDDFLRWDMLIGRCICRTYDALKQLA
jgi:hypothetical protein